MKEINSAPAENRTTWQFWDTNIASLAASSSLHISRLESKRGYPILYVVGVNISIANCSSHQVVSQPICWWSNQNSQQQKAQADSVRVKNNQTNQTHQTENTDIWTQIMPVLEQVQRSHRCPILGCVQGQAKWALDYLMGLVGMNACFFFA